MIIFPGKLAILQRVLPSYRVPFIELLAAQCQGGLSIFAGEPLAVESITNQSALKTAKLYKGRNFQLFHPRHPLFLCWQSDLVSWLEGANPDVLIVEANPRYLSTSQAVRWMHARGRPVLGWGLGAPPISGPFRSIRKNMRDRLVGSLDGIIAYSKRGAREYLNLELLRPDRVFTASNAVAPPPTGSPPNHKITGKPKLLFVGRLQARKRLDLLFKACESLPQNLQPALRIVGDGPAREYFEESARRHYPAAVFAGHLQGDALIEKFEEANLFVLPGTGGLAVQEAMSHALPVIVAQGDGTQDDLVRSENGWQVKPGDLSDLRAAILAALTDPELARKGLESYRIVKDEINLHKMVDQLLSAVNITRGNA